MTRFHSAKRTFLLPVAGFLIAGAGVSASAFASPGDSASWSFNLPSTAVASQNPPYPSVATLQLVETSEGVQFTLTPTWADAPFGRFGANALIERLDYVFDSRSSTLTDFTPIYPGTLSNSDFRWDSGAPIKGFDYPSGRNMDSGYKSDTNQIVIDFFSKNNDPEERRFDTTFVNSIWTVLGRALGDFTGTFAEANGKPSPTQGIISVTAYSLDGLTPTPSNWVTGPAATSVPEPALLGLLGIGLVALGAVRPRKQ